MSLDFKHYEVFLNNCYSFSLTLSCSTCISFFFFRSIIHSEFILEKWFKLSFFQMVFQLSYHFIKILPLPQWCDVLPLLYTKFLYALCLFLCSVFHSKGLLVYSCYQTLFKYVGITLHVITGITCLNIINNSVLCIKYLICIWHVICI